MSRSANNTTINLDIKPKNFENLTEFTGLIEKRFKNSKLSYHIMMNYHYDTQKEIKIKITK